jgi:predicted nucleic acid-binding Zn ribbon protein
VRSGGGGAPAWGNGGFAAGPPPRRGRDDEGLEQPDPNIVAHAQPTGLRKGTLFVTVDSSVWLSEIVRYRRKEILERLQHSFGRDLIARISFRVE